MNNKQLFTKAHSLTKKVIKDGDDYQVTFSACLKVVRSEEIKASKPAYKNVVNLFQVGGVSVTLFVLCLSMFALSALFFDDATIAMVFSTVSVYNIFGRKEGIRDLMKSYRYVYPKTKFVFC